MAQASPLTVNDTAVLSLIFDPEASQSSSASTIAIDPALPDHPTLSPATLAALRRRELIAIKKAERAIAISTEGGDSAPQLGDTEYPAYPGGWNNLAQLRRVRIQFLGEHVRGAALDVGAEECLIERHLKKAIELATAPSAAATISASTAKTLQASYNQLGVLYLAWSKSRDHAREAREGGAAAAGWEEKASWAFGMAGNYGSELGRTMAARTNPYAKMCAGMVREAMKMEISAGGVF
ncbi:hypothetical protein DFH27DRAFT_512207 [Peziza echinospora]|nr:hypothetical protein DFH27DRAFT_512207 [Peziza echinospora]